MRALVRDPVRASKAFGDGIQLVTGDFAAPASLRAAMDGVDAVFLACGNVPQQVDHECAAIDEAEDSGVRHIVKLSARGAELGAQVAFWHWHALIEEHLRSAEVPATVLRPGFLMTNLMAAADQVRQQGMLFAPAAAARIAMIDPGDVAAAAAATLAEDGHDGATYVLTGPAAITYQQVAAELSAATDRPVRFVDIPSEAAGQALTAAGLPSFAGQQIVAVFAALRGGAQAETTDAMAILTGRAARPFAEFARDHADAFRGRVATPLNA